MGRTKGNSRSSSSTSSSARSFPYGLDLPENKTVAQLKYELSNRGIEFPNNTKKSQLIKLVKNYATRMTRPVQTPDNGSEPRSRHVRTGTFPVSGAAGCKQTWRPP